MENRDSEQSERQLGQQSNYFQVRPELAGSLRSGRIRPDVNQQESSNGRLISGSAECRISDETGLVTGIIEAPLQQQAENQTFNISGQAVDQSVVECEERRMSPPVDPTIVTSPTRRMPNPVEITSPTAYDENRMPRTVGASSFTMTVLRAQGLRTQIVKISGNIEEYIGSRRYY